MKGEGGQDGGRNEVQTGAQASTSSADTLVLAARVGNLSEVKALIERGVNPNTCDSQVIKYWDTTIVYQVEDSPQPSDTYPPVESHPYDMVYFQRVSGEISFAG